MDIFNIVMGLLLIIVAFILFSQFFQTHEDKLIELDGGMYQFCKENNCTWEREGDKYIVFKGDCKKENATIKIFCDVRQWLHGTFQFEVYSCSEWKPIFYSKDVEKYCSVFIKESEEE